MARAMHALLVMLTALLAAVGGSSRASAQWPNAVFNDVYQQTPVTQQCVNGSFEMGFAGWTGFRAKRQAGLPYENFVASLGAPLLSTSCVAGAGIGNSGSGNTCHVIESSGSDPNLPSVSHPMTVAGASSLRLGGNDFTPASKSNGFAIDGAAKRFVVQAANAIYRFRYSSVMDKAHDLSTSYTGDEPYFQAIAIDPTTGAIIDQFVQPASGFNPLMVLSPDSPPNTPMVYSVWSCAQLDLSGYVGKEVIVYFVNSDCSQGGHTAYTYIDDVCAECDGDDIKIDPAVDTELKLCEPGKTTQINGTFTIPPALNTSNVTVTIEVKQAGATIGTLTGGTISGNTYSFALSQADLNGLGCYDFVAVLEYDVTTPSGNVVHVRKETDADGFKPGQDNDICTVDCPPKVTGCLEDSKVKVKCNGDGTYTLTLNSGAFTGNDITLVSQTPGVTVTPPQQTWSASTSWTVVGATPGQTVTLTANTTQIGGGSEKGTDLCCSGEITIVMPDCPPPIDIAIEKTVSDVKAESDTGPWTFTYTLDVWNVGSPFSPGSSITISDPVPTGLSFDSVAGSGWTCSTTPINVGSLGCTYAFGSGVLATGTHLAPLVITVSVKDPGDYKNCATTGITAGPTETTLVNNTSCVGVVIPKPPIDVKIEKGGEVVTVADMPQPGVSQFSYTLTVTNVGAGFAGANAITVSDYPQTNVTFTSVTAAPSANWTNCQLLAGVVSCIYNGPGPVLAGDVLGTITVTGFVTNLESWENCASVDIAPATGSDSDTSNNKSCVTLKVPVIDVSLTKSFEKGPTDRTGTFTFKVKNEADDIVTPGTTIKITDPVPSGVTLTGYGGTSASNWACVPPFNVVGPNTLTCTYIGPAGTFSTGTFLPDLAVDATLAAPPNTEEIGIYQNCAGVGLINGNGGGAVTETTTANNSACAVTDTINSEGDCATAGNCPSPEAMCKQDVLFIVDASPSITNLPSVKLGLKNFLVAMQGGGGSADIFSFNNGGIGTSNPSWTSISGGWQLVSSSNAPTMANSISLGGTRTDWDDALHHGLDVATGTSADGPPPLGAPPLVIFITDGEPTAYINDTSLLEIDSYTMLTTGSQQAVPWINAIRGNGSPLIAVGFGPVSSSGYLDSAFTGNSVGPGNVTLETSNVIKMGDVSSLPGVLATLGNQMCGTLSLNKSISPSYFPHQIPLNATSVAVNDTIPFTLALTNNATTPVTGVAVTDQVPSPTLSNVTIGTASLGTASVASNLVTWLIPMLGARQTATLTFTGNFVKTYTAPADETYTNYAQVVAADNYSATNLADMNPVSGPVDEPDESLATFREIIYSPPPNPCVGDNQPISCFLSVNKYPTNPGAEDNSCTSSAPGGSSNPCPFTINIGLNNIPPGSTVAVSDQLTLNGTPVTWPGAVTPPTFCTPLPTSVSFSCTHTPATSFSGSVTVTIPPGQSGPLKNCITVTVTNPAPPFSKTLTGCATVTLTQPAHLVCSPGTTKRGTECVPIPSIDLGIKKTGTAASGRSGTDATFTLDVTNVGAAFAGTNVITVTDAVPDGMTLSSAAGPNWSCSPIPVTGPATLTCTYTGGGPTAAGQSLGSITVTGSAQGDGPFKNCASVELEQASGLQETTLRNNKDCATVATVAPPPACDPRTTKLTEDSCACRYRHMTRSSPTSCECGDGTHLVTGKGCVPDVVCRRPMVLNSDATGCDCPSGFTKKGKTCVRPLTCRAPLIPNAAGTACGCADGLVRSGRTCVRPLTCRAPLIPNAAGTACGCADGLVRSGRTCVRPLQCPPPLVPNARRTDCVCPRGMEQHGNECVRPVRCAPGTVLRRGECVRARPSPDAGDNPGNSEDKPRRGGKQPRK